MTICAVDLRKRVGGRDEREVASIVSYEETRASQVERAAYSGYPIADYALLGHLASRALNTAAVSVGVTTFCFSLASVITILAILSRLQSCRATADVVFAL